MIQYLTHTVVVVVFLAVSSFAHQNLIKPLDRSNYGLQRKNVISTCSYTSYHISILQKSPHIHHVCSFGSNTDTHFTCMRRVYRLQYLLHLTVEEDVCVFVLGEQMDSAPSLLLSPVLLAGVWHERATGHGNQRGVMSPPTLSGPPISLSGRHLPHLQPHSSLEILLPKDPAKREGELLQIWLTRALGGELRPACCNHLCSPSLLSDFRTIGGVEWLSGGLGVICLCVCVHMQQIYACHLADWLSSLRCWMLRHDWVPEKAHNPATSSLSKFMGWIKGLCDGWRSVIKQITG